MIQIILPPSSISIHCVKVMAMVKIYFLNIVTEFNRLYRKRTKYQKCDQLKTVVQKIFMLIGNFALFEN